MTKKIGVSLPDDLYEWAAAEVGEGRAESVSALLATALEQLESRAQVAAIVADLRSDTPADSVATDHLDRAFAAADRAQRRSTGKVA